MISMKMGDPQMGRSAGKLRGLRILILESPAVRETRSHEPRIHQEADVLVFQEDRRVIQQMNLHWLNLKKLCVCPAANLRAHSCRESRPLQPCDPRRRAALS